MGARRLRKAVSGGTGFRRIIHLKETSSTNDVAKQEARAGAPEGTVIVAEHQTAGRGRRGRTWVTPPGTALTFSVVLRPPVEPRQAPLLVFLAAAAVREVVAELIASNRRAAGEGADAARRDGRTAADGGVDDSPHAAAHVATHPDRERVLIKWPNDVVVDGRKVCGVLVELNADPGRVQWCVVGVGVNVNQLPDDFPVELRGQATSIRMVTGCRLEREPLLRDILAGMVRRYEHMLRHGFDELLAEVRSYSATIGKHVRVHESDGSHWDGLALDVQKDGALLIRPSADRGAGAPGHATAVASEQAVASADQHVAGHTAASACQHVAGPAAERIDYAAAVSAERAGEATPDRGGRAGDREHGDVVAVYAADVSVRSER